MPENTPSNVKKQSRKSATEWVANEEPSSMKPFFMEFTRIDGNSTLYSIQRIKTSVRIRVEQDIDTVVKSLKLKILGQPQDEVLLTSYSRFEHYEANGDRIVLRNVLLFRKSYGEIGSFKYYQLLKPKQLVDEVLRSLHWEFGKHPGFTKAIIAHRRK